MDYDMEPHYELLDLYFQDRTALTRHAIHSFHNLIAEDIPRILNGQNVFHEQIRETTVVRQRFEYSDIGVTPPTTEPDDKVLYPLAAMNSLTDYSLTITATVRQMEDTVQIQTGLVTSQQVGEEVQELPIAKVPCMVGSRYCNLVLRPDSEGHHSPLDSGGYFIVKGGEKVLMIMQSMVQRQPMVLYKRDQNKSYYYVTIQSRSSESPTGTFQNFVVHWRKGRLVWVTNKNRFREMSVFRLIRALGLENDRDICRAICDPDRDVKMMNMLSSALHSDLAESQVQTRDQALAALLEDMSYNRKNSSTDPEIRDRQKANHLRHVLIHDILPHVTSRTGDEDLDMLYKAHNICYAIRCLLRGVLMAKPDDPKRGCDDRDSMLNKRMEVAGHLITGLFDSFYRKMLAVCNRSFVSKSTPNGATPNVIRFINPGIIRQGIRLALSTGNFIHSSRVGVSMPLNRNNHLNAESYKRRVVTPTSEKVKLTAIRQLHSTAYGSIDPVETPNSDRVGMVRGLALMAEISVNMYDQPAIIEALFPHWMTVLEQAPPHLLHSQVKVFLNGVWRGVTDRSREFHQHLREMRWRGELHRHVSCHLDCETRQLNIRTDGGRFLRPYLVVENDRLLFRPEMLKGIRSWEEFLVRHPGVIEYLDKEEEAQMMLALLPYEIEANQAIMDREVSTEAAVLDEIDRTNRYDGLTYCHYTHCEIHPATVLGVMGSNMPYLDRNPAIRTIFQSSQYRNAMGVYAADYLWRMAISYLFSHPQIPLVDSRLAVYTGSNTLPCGENVIAAILSYTGWNQEDSIVLNRSAVDLGLFRAHSLKKYISTTERNKSTARAQTFTKPDPSRVDGMRRANYDKLTEAGYVPEETRVEEGDAIVGMVEPKGNIERGEAPFKDRSTIYKGNVPGTVDKVIIGEDESNYKTISLRIRTERHPIVGDKFGSRHGQKGTAGSTTHAADMPFTESGMVPDLIINPNCLPGRMTIGQVIEMLHGKVCAVKGVYGDATPFTGTANIEQVTGMLRELGLDEWGTETLYCGYSGEKMQVQIFMGPVYYLRLKQMVDDKIYAHATGPKQVLTRQPQEGRSKDGGMRVGEMERDVFIGHGAAQTIREKLMECSDAWTGRVCDLCGTFVWRSPAHHQYYCKACDSSLTHTVVIPYSLKLLSQELMAMGIMPRIRTGKSIALPNIVTAY